MTTNHDTNPNDNDSCQLLHEIEFDRAEAWAARSRQIELDLARAVERIHDLELEAEMRTAQPPRERRLTENVTDAPTTAPSCTDNDAALVSTGANCATLASLGHCDTYFCTSCPYAGICDASCGLCSITPSPTPMPIATVPSSSTLSPSLLGTGNACEDNNVAVSQATGFECATLAALGYCETALCPTCNAAGSCDVTCGYCSSSTATPTIQLVPSQAPTTSPVVLPSSVPTVSTRPTTFPTVAAVPQLLNVSNFTELKAAVEGAPSCGIGRVQVNILGAVKMGLNDSAIQLPALSCITVVGGAAPLRSDSRRLGESETPVDAQYTRLTGNGRDRLFHARGFVREFKLRRLLLSNGYAFSGSGGAASFDGGCGECAIFQCFLANHGAVGSGGALHFQGGSSFVRLDETQFVSNSALVNGGAVSVSESVAVRLQSVTFFNNSAETGGAMYAEYESVVDADEVHFSNNTASWGGGGLACAYDNIVRIQGGVAMANVAENFEGFVGGGAFHFVSGNSVEVLDFIAEANIAKGGGAVLIEDSCTVVMQNVSFKSNTARDSGGAVLLRYGSTAYIFGGIAVENTATEMGGSFFVHQSSTLFLSGFSAVDNQCGGNGGVVFVYFSSNFYATGMVATGNVAGANGGVLFVASRGRMKVTNSSFTKGTAGTHGGGLLGYGADSIELDRVNFTNMRSTQKGGGLSISSTSRVKMLQVTISHCESGSSGGAAVIYDSAFELVDSIIADSRAAESGGGLHFSSTSISLDRGNLTRVVFLRNSADANGGAVVIERASIAFTNVTAIENRAVGGVGGALCVGGTGSPANAILFDAMLIDNDADASAGGGIFLFDGSHLSSTRSVISGNRAHKRGGGVACDGSAVVTLHSGVEIYRNTAPDGGAVSLGDGGALLETFGAVEMHGNTAENGGAIHLGAAGRFETHASCQSITLHAVTSSGYWDEAPDDGRVVLAATNASGEEVLPSCCVDALGHPTSVKVADILLETSSGTHSMKYCLVPGSYTAFVSSPYGGNYDTSVATVIKKAVALDAMTSSGEVLFESTTQPVTFDIQEQKFDRALTLVNNTASIDGGGVYIGNGAWMQTEGLVAQMNSASRDGGAVYAYGASASMIRAKLIGNVAGRDGGAISLGLLSSVAIDATACVDNRAGVNGGAIAAKKDAQLSASSSILVGNAAGADGGGFSLSEMAEAVSTIVSCVVSNNTALFGFGGGGAASNAGLLLSATRFESNQAKSGGGVASMAQEDPVLTTTALKSARGCVSLVVELDWLPTQGSCEPYNQVGQNDANSLIATCDSGRFDSCAGNYARRPQPDLLRDNCTGCPCNHERAPVAAYETFATIVDTTMPWDGWSFAVAQDADGNDAFVLPRANAHVSETFCLAPGLYTFAAFDKITIPHGRMWWGGTYRLVLDGTVLAHSSLGSQREMVNFTVANNTAAGLNMFVSNAALNGGGGAVFWDQAPPDNFVTNARFDGNMAVYGSVQASDATSLVLNGTNRPAISAISGQSLTPPIVVELRDAYGHRVLSDDVSSVLVELNNKSTRFTLSGSIVRFDRGVAVLSDLAIEAMPGATVGLELTVSTLGDPIPALSIEVTLKSDCPLGQVEENTRNGNTICTVCPIGTFRSEGSSECRACIRGMDCEKTAGWDVATVPISIGYWRSGVPRSIKI